MDILEVSHRSGGGYIVGTQPDVAIPGRGNGKMGHPFGHALNFAALLGLIDRGGQVQFGNSEDDALEVVRLTNEERSNHGVGTLEVDEDLMALAKIRAEEVSTKYSHERPDGSHVVQMGYGENVGAKASAEKQVTSWMGSDGHRTNILREVYTRIGVGCYQTEGGKYYWVQIFSR